MDKYSEKLRAVKDNVSKMNWMVEDSIRNKLEKLQSSIDRVRMQMVLSMKREIIQKLKKETAVFGGCPEAAMSICQTTDGTNFSCNEVRHV